MDYDIRKNNGINGESEACELLCRKGFLIAERNFRSRFGEIDIIAYDRKYIVFAEVKARGTTSIASPAEFVMYSKQKKIEKTAEYYMMKYGLKLQPRFDVIEVYLDNENRVVRMNHIINAWEVN